MRAEIFWITDFLATMPRPRGNDWLEDEIVSYKNYGVDVVVSLLEADEISELEIEKEQFYCEQNGLIFLNFPIGDRQIPRSFEETFSFVKKINDYIEEKKKIAVHCRQGIGRASLIAACVLIVRGFSVEDAFGKIVEKRGCQVPDTKEQLDWVRDFSLKINSF